jgi:hypothetical protein
VSVESHEVFGLPLHLPAPWLFIYKDKVVITWPEKSELYRVFLYKDAESLDQLKSDVIQCYVCTVLAALSWAGVLEIHHSRLPGTVPVPAEPCDLTDRLWQRYKSSMDFVETFADVEGKGSSEYRFQLNSVMEKGSEVRLVKGVNFHDMIKARLQGEAMDLFNLWFAPGHGKPIIIDKVRWYRIPPYMILKPTKLCIVAGTYAQGFMGGQTSEWNVGYSSVYSRCLEQSVDLYARLMVYLSTTLLE